MTQLLDVAIIGAGLSGLIAARTLINAGKRVQVFDKGASVGGRLATRRVGGGLADHGAQFFTVRDAAFREYVEEWLADGLVFEWSRGWSDGSSKDANDGHPRYAVHGGMNALAKHLAKGLSIKTNAQIASVSRIEGGWRLTDQMGATTDARAVILTPPVPQSLALCEKGGVTLPQDAQEALSNISYQPCVAAMMVVEGEIRLPAPGVLQRPDADLYWIGDNQRKGISSVPIITVQASGAYSQQLYDLHDDDVTERFKADLSTILGDITYKEVQIKRWRYSQPNDTYPERTLRADVPLQNGETAPLLFAGDAFGGPRVEGAFLSGLAAGEKIVLSAED